ncbi:MAG TPA: TIGR02757 family protein [Prolixibacteraceae bacterium]|nr:TIGR02757 family protein [Prolixibacteraceae bacterium]
MNNDELKAFLDEKYWEYNNPSFIELDPISIPHRFDKKEDIEIAGFLAATIAWGNRTMIIKNGNRLMKEMGYFPHEFIVNASERDLLAFENFVHRTFNGTDTIFFLKALQQIYLRYGGLEKVFTNGFLENGNLAGTLHHFRNVFLSTPHEKRSEKHLADVARKSSGKRLCMFLRWMVRNDNRGVDFGLWNGIPSSALMLPLDLHTGNTSRQLGLLERKQNDWQAVEEVTAKLRTFDAADPVKYDFALFGLGINHEI